MIFLKHDNMQPRMLLPKHQINRQKQIMHIQTYQNYLRSSAATMDKLINETKKFIITDRKHEIIFNFQYLSTVKCVRCIFYITESVETRKRYLLRESAVTRRRSSMVAAGEDGKIPKSTRHLTPLRPPKRREHDAVSGIAVSIVSAILFS